MTAERGCDVTMMTTEEYLQAEFDYTLAEARRGFKIHAVVFAVVMTGLITLNALLIAFTDANFPWAIFPLVGWGIGLTAHYFCGFRGAEGEIRARQSKIEEYATRPRAIA
jgi:2TM domain